jgi:hypothetical protein
LITPFLVALNARRETLCQDKERQQRLVKADANGAASD